MKRYLIFFLLLLGTAWTGLAPAKQTPSHTAFIDSQIATHSGQSGVLVLDKGADALIARAWLADHARQSIEVQYFIWSTDNIGILASEALLRAAERGVQVRVIVDDLLVDAPDLSLLALAHHPNVEIRIYNPRHSVGIPWYRRLWNVLTGFRSANQRMHDKTFIVDGRLAITGGRNMAAEYFDYNHDYNFRDRDILVLGDAAGNMRQSFEHFWSSSLSVPVERLLADTGQDGGLDEAAIASVYRDLHAYAASGDNFAPEVHAAIENVTQAFNTLAQQITWCPVEFISDIPGKNDGSAGLEGGGRTGSALAQLVSHAKTSIVIQSPYLVMSDQARQLFRDAIRRGVKVSISTNSMASTDNLQAFSGYRNQRKELLGMGVDIYEYKPAPAIQREMMRHSLLAQGHRPVFAIHAKTMVVDGATVFIGTFNFDPRSQNLNTEAGVIVRDGNLAKSVESAIQTDMQPGNSWSAKVDEPDLEVSWLKRVRVRFWQMMPIKPLL